MQHLCVITNSVDLISDPIQGHNFTLGEPEIDEFFSFSTIDNSRYCKQTVESHFAALKVFFLIKS